MFFVNEKIFFPRWDENKKGIVPRTKEETT